MNAVLFDLAFYVTVPFWALMVFAPTWSWTHRIVSSPWIVLPPLAVWAVLGVPRLPELWALFTTPTVEKLTAFAADGAGITLIWAQVIAWDLFIGRWMYLESRRLGIHPLIMGPLLVFTILLSPIGLPVFLVLRARTRA